MDTSIVCLFVSIVSLYRPITTHYVVAQSFQPQIPTFGSVSDDVAGWDNSGKPSSNGARDSTASSVQSCMAALCVSTDYTCTCTWTQSTAATMEA